MVLWALPHCHNPIARGNLEIWMTLNDKVIQAEKLAEHYLNIEGSSLVNG